MSRRTQLRNTGCSISWDIHNEPGAPAGTISGASVVVVAADVVAVVVVDFFG